MEEIQAACIRCESVSELYDTLGRKWDFSVFQWFLKAFKLWDGDSDKVRFLIVSKGEEEITQAHLEAFAGSPFHMKYLVKRLSKDVNSDLHPQRIVIFNFEFWDFSIDRKKTEVPHISLHMFHGKSISRAYTKVKEKPWNQY